MKPRIKRMISLALVLVMALSAFCISVNAVEGDTVTYSYIVTSSADIAAYDGEVTYPDTLSVKSFDGPEWASVKDGKLLFNCTEYEDPYDFSGGAVMITVVFDVQGDYSADDINTKLVEFFSTSQVQGQENTPYTYVERIDGNDAGSGYVDIDNPDNNSNDVYVLSGGKTVNLKGTFSRDAADSKDFGFDEDFRNAQIIGVQKKNSGNKDLRFVAVLRNEIAQDADSYGFIALGSTTVARARERVESFTLETAGSRAFNCKNTDNNVSGDYGVYSTNTPYKYVTYAVDGIGDNAVAVMFYIKKGSNVYYCEYKNGAGNYLKSCAVNWALLG